MKVKLYTLGCKVNQYETQEITEDLLKNGFSVTLNQMKQMFLSSIPVQ